MKTKPLKINYYSDLVNDDFAGTKIDTKQTPADFCYINKNIFYRIGSFLLYYLIVKPLVFFYCKISLHQSFVNKKIVKKLRKSGFFIYANHTLLPEDAFIPNRLSKKKNYIIVGPDTTSIKGIKTLVTMIGAFPIPSTVEGSKNFVDSIGIRVNQNASITIYPEAHIWPYYTEIRPFPSTSFKYPVTFNKPAISLTNVFVKSKNPLRKKPVVKTYVDGPFFPDMNLNPAQACLKLHEEIYQTMVKRSHQQKQIKYKFDYIQK